MDPAMLRFQALNVSHLDAGAIGVPSLTLDVTACRGTPAVSPSGLKRNLLLLLLMLPGSFSLLANSSGVLGIGFAGLSWWLGQILQGGDSITDGISDTVGILILSHDSVTMLECDSLGNWHGCT